MCKVRRDIYNKATELRGKSDKWFCWGFRMILIFGTFVPVQVMFPSSVISKVVMGVIILVMWTCMAMSYFVDRASDRLFETVIEMMAKEAENERHGDDS